MHAREHAHQTTEPTGWASKVLVYNPTGTAQPEQHISCALVHCATAPHRVCISSGPAAAPAGPCADPQPQTAQQTLRWLGFLLSVCPTAACPIPSTAPAVLALVSCQKLLQLPPHIRSISLQGAGQKGKQAVYAQQTKHETVSTLRSAMQRVH